MHSKGKCHVSGLARPRIDVKSVDRRLRDLLSTADLHRNMFSVTQLPLEEIVWQALHFEDDILFRGQRPVVVRMVGTVVEALFVVSSGEPPCHQIVADFLRHVDYQAAGEILFHCSGEMTRPPLYFMTATNLENARPVSPL